MQESDKNYHHGNLKQALIDAYLDLLETTPSEKISLRKVAGHVGVAPTAVYNHFSDKIALETAVKFRCLEHFTEFLESASSSDMEPEARINALGKAYYRYSIEHVQYYECIFKQDVPPEYITDELVETSMRAEAELRSAVIALLEKNAIPKTKYNEGLGAFACWSIAHGITSLAAKQVNRAACANGRWPDEFMLLDEAAVNSCFESMTKVLVAGILAAAVK